MAAAMAVAALFKSKDKDIMEAFRAKLDLKCQTADSCGCSVSMCATPNAARPTERLADSTLTAIDIYLLQQHDWPIMALWWVPSLSIEADRMSSNCEADKITTMLEQ